MGRLANLLQLLLIPRTAPMQRPFLLDLKSMRLTAVINSIMRASFRKSSFGLQRKGYMPPSDPSTVTFLGRCNEPVRPQRDC